MSSVQKNITFYFDLFRFLLAMIFVVYENKHTSIAGGRKF